MTTNLISRLLDYFYSQEKFAAEIMRAMKEFLDVPADGVLLTFPEELSPHFSEWLIYDFKLADGRSPLKYFYEVNPCKLSPWVMQEYKDLQENEYGLYEVLRVDPDVGLEIRNLSSGNKYYAREHAATFRLNTGVVFFTRVAKNGDHYELVGANSLVFPIKLGDGLRQKFGRDKQKLSPKDIRALITGDQPAQPEKIAGALADQKLSSITEIEDHLAGFLLQSELGKMVSAVKIKEWLEKGIEEDREQGYLTPISLLFGLNDGRLKTEKLNELLDLVILFYNSLPRTEFRGLSPAEKAKVNDARGIAPSFRSNAHQIGSDWYKHFKKGMDYFSHFKFASALKQYDDVFCELLKGKTTMPELYRLYANKATAHLALAQETEAVKMLEIALELNPNYDFANYQLSKYRLGKFKEPLQASLLAELATRGGLPKNAAGLAKVRKNMAAAALKALPLDPAVRYYEFIKPYGINFATDRPTESKIFTAGDRSPVKKK